MSQRNETQALIDRMTDESIGGLITKIDDPEDQPKS